MAKVLLNNLGLETIARVDRPAMIGETLHLKCTFIDVSEGIVKLADATRFDLETDDALVDAIEGDGADDANSGVVPVEDLELVHEEVIVR